LLTPPAEAAASQKWKIIYLQVLSTQNAFEAFDKAADALGGSFFLKRSISNPQVAFVLHPEGHPRDNSYFVLFNQPFYKFHRVQVFVYSQQKIERSIGAGNGD
jgi:hypothetical protein